MRLLPLLLGIALLAAGPSFAQSNLTLYLDGGPEVTNQPKQFGDFYSTGVRVGGGVGYAINRDLEILLRAHYDALPFDETGTKRFLVEGGFIGRGDETDTQVDGTGADLVSGSLNLKVNSSIGRNLGIYLIGGVGLHYYETYGVNVDFPPGSAEESFLFQQQDGVDVGFNVGFGLSLPATENIDVRVEPQFVFVFSGKGEETVPFLERTGDLSYIPVHLGVAWRL